jgi:hypothetical protein
MNLTQLIDIKERVAVGETLTPTQRVFVLECINEAVDRRVNEGMVEMSAPRNYLGRIDHIWAFLSLDDGGEGVCAAPLGPGAMTVPLIAADKRRLDSLKPLARKLASIFQKPIRLAKFTTREDVEIYQPESAGEVKAAHDQ